MKGYNNCKDITTEIIYEKTSTCKDITSKDIIGKEITSNDIIGKEITRLFLYLKNPHFII